ncbi:MAG TPA: thioesterase family protein [Bacillota bacterium]|nr:thioesterase family protein [Bacillota bacterium]
MKEISYIKNIDKWRAGFSFSMPIRIRFSEVDMFGHMNNVSTFTYFEVARIEFLKSIGLFGNDDKSGIPIVADLQCDYLMQVFFDENISLFVKATDVGTTSFDLHYMGVNERDDICFTGRGRMVYVDSKSGKPIPLSETMKNQLLKQ